jgi:hypothetical protein
MGRQAMSLEYSARAMGIDDSPDGRKVLVFRTDCGRTVKVYVAHNMADFAIKELTTVGAPAA